MVVKNQGQVPAVAAFPQDHAGLSHSPVRWELLDYRCLTKLPGETLPRSAPSSWGTHDRPKCRHHQGPAWWANEFSCGHLQEQRWLTDICITKFYPSMGGSSQSRKPGAGCTAHRQHHRLESVLSRCPSWSKPLLGSSAHFCCSQAAGLVSESFQLW